MFNYFNKVFILTASIFLLPLLSIELLNNTITASDFLHTRNLIIESSFSLAAAEETKPDQTSELNTATQEQNPFRFTPSGFIELENYFSSDKNRSLKDQNLKNELRANLEIKAGYQDLYLYSKTNFYYIPQFKNEKEGNNYHYRNDFNISDNLKISDNDYEIEPNELYINYSNTLFRFRAGNQIYLWGTSDLYNPTSYFNPLDYREYLFADEDELRLAVPSGSLMFFLDFATIELVFVPVNIPVELPAEGNYWMIKSSSPDIRFKLGENEGMDKKISNSAYGIRSSFSPGGVDFSLSYYHGPDRNPLFIPESADLTQYPLITLEIVPEYYTVNKFGFDLSTQISDFVFQCEAIYSPDKQWLVEQDLSNPLMIQLPFKTEKSHYVHYAAGFNYYIPVNRMIKDYDGESILTVEWQQPWYSNDKLMKPMVSKILLIRFEEICLDSKLKLSATYITEINKKAHIIKPEIKYEFEGGLSLKASYVYIKSESANPGSILPDEDTSMIYYMRDRDMAAFSARYVF